MVTLCLKKIKHIVIVYKPALIWCMPDIIGYYQFDSEDGVYVLIKELNLQRKARCDVYDDCEEVETILYWCTEEN